MKTAVAGLSLALSLCLAELCAAALHHHAYPFLNLFVRDAAYGVRLRPSSATRIRSRSGRITEIATNSLGFRGPEWPAPSDALVRGRVLLVGDSQALGFNVAWPDSLPARLEDSLGAGTQVLDAAVPSWGPTEYARAVAELAPRYRPEWVVFLANAANDWFEAAVPDRERTTAVDGWAERYVPGAPPPRAFFGRAFLLGRSHLVLAARELYAHSRAHGVAPSEPARLLERDLAQLHRPKDGGYRSPLMPAVLAAARACRAAGCHLLVAALPLDVQVDAREWAKYHEAPRDLTATEVLLGDLVSDARAAGLQAVNLLGPLRAASPGAFLSDDYHLSPRGSRAGARAIARALLKMRDARAGAVARVVRVDGQP